MLAQRVAELVAGGSFCAGEVVVLLRAASDLAVYERALQDRGLRTLAAVGSFWGHQQVGDLLAWLRALANPLDELALYSTLASPLVGISSDGLALLALQARTDGAGVWATLARRRAASSTPASPPPTASAWRASPSASPASAAPRRRTASPNCCCARSPQRLRTARAPLSWGERRLANIHKLLRLARRFEAAEGRGLRGFLDHVAQRRAPPRAPSPRPPPAPSPTPCA